MKIKFDACVYKTQLTGHDKIKNRLLNLINETPFQSLTSGQQIPNQTLLSTTNILSLPNWDCHISRCDWNYSCDWNRPWFKLFRPNFDLSVRKIVGRNLIMMPFRYTRYLVSNNIIIMIAMDGIFMDINLPEFIT